jgi:formylglycine-generating enzyme required for sulfatase activity
MGCQSDDPGGRNDDPDHEGFEGPVHEVGLFPFFLSKYEMSRAQWLRLTGHDGSTAGRDGRWLDSWTADGSGKSLLQPVTDINWTETKSVLNRWGGRLPTETPWDLAAVPGR